MHSPKPITKIMTLINNNSLPSPGGRLPDAEHALEAGQIVGVKAEGKEEICMIALDLLGANLQHTNHTNLLLPFSLDANDLPSLKRVLMAPGLTSPGGRLPDAEHALEAGQIVGVKAEGKVVGTAEG
jgi:hypothetical protein